LGAHDAAPTITASIAIARIVFIGAALLASLPIHKHGRRFDPSEKPIAGAFVSPRRPRNHSQPVQCRPPMPLVIQTKRPLYD
jgi:hypothetical protein